jgi:ribosomal protein L7Ae-like RNA K-turn-binding protein
VTHDPKNDSKLEPTQDLTPEQTRKLLGLVGLGYRARNAIAGVQMVRDAAMRGRLKFAIVAPDVSRHSLDKLIPLLSAKRIRFVMGPGAVELGQAVGRESTAAVGILDGQLARGMRQLLEAAGAASAQGARADDRAIRRKV